MDTALANANAASAATPPNGLLDRLLAMPAAAKMKLGMGVAMLAAVIVSIGMWSSQGDWRVLFAGLPDKDAGAVVAQLSTMNVPYRIGEGGTTILVPADKVYDARLKLATAGLPKAAVPGWEALDKQSFGVTHEVEKLNINRGLEGELIRTISSLDAVESARVHIAQPDRNAFFREDQNSSASVVVMLHPGRTLDAAQLAGIVHLVSSSVTGLSPKAVSVLDQTGTLLTQTDDHAAQGLDPSQLQYVSQIETNYQKRVRELLEPVVGRDNLRATVTADIDFTQSEATSEQFKPNQADAKDQSVRSQQLSDAGGSAGATPAGVPGATTNQPPIPATAPLTGASQPLQVAQGGTTGAGGHRETVTNFEVDRTVRVTHAATGLVRHLNAAVVVNHKVTTDAKGKTTSTPLSPEEMTKLESLVQEAIGYDKTRGDSVKVINAPFRVEAAPKVEDAPVWRQSWLIDLLRAGAVPVALTLVALGVLFGLVRPAVMMALARPAEDPAARKLDAVVDDAQALGGPVEMPQLLEAPQMARKLEGARLLAKENPTAVANIVRDWVNGDVAA